MKKKFTLLFAALIMISSLSLLAQKRNTKQTSSRAATEASKVLRDPKSTKSQKTVAGSALSQSRGKSKK